MHDCLYCTFVEIRQYVRSLISHLNQLLAPDQVLKMSNGQLVIQVNTFQLSTIPTIRLGSALEAERT